METGDAGVVDVLRKFNRSYTQRIGVLDDSYLGLGRPLGPSRLLFEIDAEGVSIRQLRDRLNLDSGYLSRLLTQLKDEGLVSVSRDPADGRRRLVQVTAKGRRQQQKLDERSEMLARTLVSPLTDSQRTRLAQALTTADRLLQCAAVEMVVVDPASAEAQWAMGEYFAELDERFRAGFDPGQGGAGADIETMGPPGGAFVLLRTNHQVVGCGGLLRIEARTAEIKRMWIHRQWRGLGLASRLLADLERLIIDLGYNRVVLDTNEVLVEAVAMYERAGYQAIDRYNDNPYAHHWFAKGLD